MKKFLMRVATSLMALLTVCAFAACNLEGYKMVKEPTMTASYYKYLGGYNVEIEGELENTSEMTWSFCSIEFSVYDEEGRNLGTAIDTINNLKYDEVWKFEATMGEYSDTKPVRFELVEVKHW